MYEVSIKRGVKNLVRIMKNYKFRLISPRAHLDDTGKSKCDSFLLFN